MSTKTGKPALWIIPKGGEPFSMRTYYPPYGPLFSDAVRSEFHRDFARIRSTESFDVYRQRETALR